MREILFKSRPPILKIQDKDTGNIFKIVLEDARPPKFGLNEGAQMTFSFSTPTGIA